MSLRLPIRAKAAAQRIASYTPGSNPRFCCKCHIRIAPLPLSIGPRQARTFASAPILFKKKGKDRSEAAKESNARDGDAESTANATADAFDFSGLESHILKATERLTHDLSQLRAGGRFNPELLEKIKVQLDKNSPETIKLKDLAQVVPKGRFINIILSDEEHIKAVRSAIQASEHSITPQGPTPESPTTLTIAIPPPTRESRQEALVHASKIAEIALHRIREARGAQQKKHRAMQVAKTVRPDDLQKAHILMEEVVKRGNSEVKSILDGAKRVLEG